MEKKDRRDSRRDEERDREERETGMKVKKEDKNVPILLLPATRLAGLAQL